VDIFMSRGKKLTRDFTAYERNVYINAGTFGLE
jgi:hypothetical protein